MISQRTKDGSPSGVPTALLGGRHALNLEWAAARVVLLRNNGLRPLQRSYD